MRDTFLRNRVLFVSIERSVHERHPLVHNFFRRRAFFGSTLKRADKAPICFQCFRCHVSLLRGFYNNCATPSITATTLRAWTPVTLSRRQIAPTGSRPRPRESEQLRYGLCLNCNEAAGLFFNRRRHRSTPPDNSVNPNLCGAALYSICCPRTPIYRGLSSVCGQISAIRACNLMLTLRARRVHTGEPACRLSGTNLPRPRLLLFV